MWLQCSLMEMTTNFDIGRRCAVMQDGHVHHYAGETAGPGPLDVYASTLVVTVF